MLSVLVFIYIIFDFLASSTKYLYICETQKIVNSSHHPLRNLMLIVFPFLLITCNLYFFVILRQAPTYLHALELIFTLLVASVIYCQTPLSSKTALNVIINLCAKVVKCDPDKFCFWGKDASNDNL